MKNTIANALAGALLALPACAAPVPEPDVNEAYPYKGPAVPIGDWVDPTINGNGKGFTRIYEPPAVTPKTNTPSNNVNVIQTSYVPDGINVHYQTPFGLGERPSVVWGTKPWALTNTAVGSTVTYNRTPSCSEVKAVTMCNEFFHNVNITGLRSKTTYYYQIPAANGTTESDIMSFTTSIDAGDPEPFTLAIVNDMGYTNAKGTHKYLNKAVEEGVSFVWHGGDLSYADDWYGGVLSCDLDSWDICMDGPNTQAPGPIPSEYLQPLPDGEIPNQGGPLGGDSSVIYETNWDIWQNWMNSITTRVPYMVLAGNHEAACAEFDGGNNTLAAYLDENVPDSHAPKLELTYYSCPPSQRNFTAFQHRFHMPGGEVDDGSVGNFWYSFDYGLAHFISFNTETDFPNSPEAPFLADTKGVDVQPAENETYVTDSGPFGRIDNDDYLNKFAYQQYQWLAKDLASVDRSVTPWVIAMAHRPMYSSQVDGYQKNIREAFEELFLENGVDVYLAGHIHWYERMKPMGRNGTIDYESMASNDTYYTNPGVSMVHLVNGMAGNVESHSVLSPDPMLPLTQVLNEIDFGFSTMTVTREKLEWNFVKADGSGHGDSLTLLKKPSGSSSSSSSSGGDGAGCESSGWKQPSWNQTSWSTTK